MAVSAFADDLETWQVRAMSFAASAAVGIYVGFDLGNLATRWREAWKHLNAARLDYELDMINLDGLGKAYREGEAIIGQVKSDVFSQPKTGE